MKEWENKRHIKLVNKAGSQVLNCLFVDLKFSTVILTRHSTKHTELSKVLANALNNKILTFYNFNTDSSQRFTLRYHLK